MFWLLLLFLTVHTTSQAERSVSKERHLVVVVGAGVSGFTAAATLLQHNVTDLLVLEASDRVGGRIHTVEFAGVPLDKGAEFVHGEVDNTVYEMLTPYKDRFLWSYAPLLESTKMLFSNTSGHVFNSTWMSKLLETSWNLMSSKELQHFNGSLADFFYPRCDEMARSNKLDPEIAEGICRLGALRETVYSAADELSQIGAWGVSEYKENEGDLLLKWKIGGYKTIFDFVSKKFPNPDEELPVLNKTVFNKQVTKITHRDKEVELECADGSSYFADHVIVTLSLGVLKKHAASMFHPALPPVKTAAIETLGFGCVGKVFLLFPTRWWPRNISTILPLLSNQELKDFRRNSVHSFWTANTTGFHAVMNHDRMLCVWFAGSSCRTMEALSEQEVINGLMELLDKLVGNKFQIERPEGILRSGWGSNPYTLGSYSLRTVASDRLNVTNDNLAEPVKDDKGKPVIMFAGEATHPQYSSTVHGALASGRREAENLANYLKH